MGRLISVCFLVLGCIGTRGHANDFVAVFFDDTSAKALKVDAPLPRALKAQLIGKLHEAEVRGLVIKFFEDLPSDKEQDRTYAKAICLVPSVLQACLCHGGSTNVLPGRFFITETNRFRLRSVMSDTEGWMPLSEFSACARSVGFVDLERRDEIPLIELYQERYVKSLYISALELETKEHADYSSGTNVVFGDRRLTFNERGEHPITGELAQFDYIPFQDVLGGKVGREKLRDKVVILGYAGERIHGIETPWGKIEAHRYFVQCLIALAADLKRVER